MSKNRNDMKKKIALLGSMITASGITVETNAAKTYDISIPAASRYSICKPKKLESQVSKILTSLTFEYITLKKLLTMRTSIPVSILTKYGQRLNQLELLYLSGGAECKMRAFCAKYLETSIYLNMDKTMDDKMKYDERMANATLLRENLNSGFSEQGKYDLCLHLTGINSEIKKMLVTQQEEIDALYKSRKPVELANVPNLDVSSGNSLTNESSNASVESDGGADSNGPNESNLSTTKSLESNETNDISVPADETDSIDDRHTE